MIEHGCLLFFFGNSKSIRSFLSQAERDMKDNKQTETCLKKFSNKLRFFHWSHETYLQTSLTPRDISSKSRARGICSLPTALFRGLERNLLGVVARCQTRSRRRHRRHPQVFTTLGWKIRRFRSDYQHKRQYSRHI